MLNLDFGTSQNLMMVKLDMLVRLDMVMGKLYFTHIWLRQTNSGHLQPNFKTLFLCLNSTYNYNKAAIAIFNVVYFFDGVNFNLLLQQHT